MNRVIGIVLLLGGLALFAYGAWAAVESFRIAPAAAEQLIEARRM